MKNANSLVSKGMVTREESINTHNRQKLIYKILIISFSYLVKEN